MAGNLALGNPKLNIYIEDSISKELTEDRLETGAFNIVGPEEMFKASTVSCANSI